MDFSYGAGPLLKGIDIAVPERSTLAIVGPSGAGKSSLLNLIARFRDVDRGRITIGGTDVRDLPEAELNALVSIVFQDGWLFEGTVRDNIAMGRPDATSAQIEEAARAAQAHAFIAALPSGYRTIVGEGSATLSSGERQRIAIARAILKDAPIVLLDEATAALDASNEIELRRALQSLASDRTVITVAHKLRAIHDADQILVLRNGEIAERGGHHDLLAQHGTYARLWHLQQHDGGWQINKD